MAALADLVVVDEVRVRPFRPTPRGLKDLVRKGGHRHRDGDVFRCEEGVLVVLPVDARRRDGRVGQPVERDVVEQVVSRETFGLAVEDAGDQRVAARVVVDEPGGEANRRILECVDRLRAMRHLLGVAQVVLVEEGQLLTGSSFVG